MFADLSTPLLFTVFAIAAFVVVVVSIKATELADIIADRTALGEAMVGALILGGATSLSGVVVSVTGAYSGDASFAFSNAVGGIAAQTLFLAIADLLHKRANLEHAAAEPANLFQAVLLLILLSLPIAAMSGPDIAYFGVHPASIALFLAYVWGVRIAGDVSDNPMWKPVETRETRHDEPEDDHEAGKSASKPIAVFVVLVAIMGACGFVISQVGGEFIERFGLSSSLVGSLVTAVVTSLPEFVTTLVAVSTVPYMIPRRCSFHCRCSTKVWKMAAASESTHTLLVRAGCQRTRTASMAATSSAPVNTRLSLSTTAPPTTDIFS